ncbi:hypothetical protein [Amycolatopsis keratiniphila]|uniref:hypothetical protein n=1 Tax=Amycolatopsis keratiniphila TaxID=129921 RepID=UPI000879E395|nr:hypothetical protein [Amycolatopsis keratiniphila]SDU44475.1 hypothetical protein SAMN04489733_4350 [Amycolatopsis keratiniphila]
MPETSRKHFADLRGQFTGEPRSLAARAIPRITPGTTPPALGLDTCNPAQKRFRAFAAPFLLNAGTAPIRLRNAHAQLASSSGASRIGWSNVVVSPQYNDLSILAEDPDHLVQCLADTTGDSIYGIPGLRPVEVEGRGDALLMKHLPTAAWLRMRYHSHYTPKLRTPPWFFPTNWRRLRRDLVLGPQERNAHDTIPPMSEDAMDLLAGLVARLTCRHEEEQWAVGWLISDPIPRPYHQQSGFDFIQLWGSQDHWTLQWGGSGSVPASDVARALTHPVVGILGARATRSGETRAEVHLRKACLTLEVHHAPRSEYLARANQGAPGEAKR